MLLGKAQHAHSWARCAAGSFICLFGSYSHVDMYQPSPAKLGFLILLLPSCNDFSISRAGQIVMVSVPVVMSK